MICDAGCHYCESAPAWPGRKRGLRSRAYVTFVDSQQALGHTSTGALDVLFVDARNNRISMTHDGAKLVLLRSSNRSISVLAHYPGATTEIYSFFQEKDGRNRYSVLTSRTGPQAAVEKSSVMVGLCDPIKFDLLPR